MEEYLVNLYNYISENDPTYKDDVSFDDFKVKMQEADYTSKMYDYINQLDPTFKDDITLDAFVEKVGGKKKKETFDSPTLPEASEVLLPDTQEPATSSEEALQKKQPLDSNPYKETLLEAKTDTGLFQEGVEGITPELIEKDEEYTVPELNYRFNDFGFYFEESGPGFDQMKVTARNGNTLNVRLDPFFGIGAKSEAEALKRFLKENQEEASKIMKQSILIQDKQRKAKNEKEIDTTVKIFNEQTEMFQQEIVDFIDVKNALDAEYEIKFKNVSPEQIKNDPQLMAQYNEWLSKRKQLQAKFKDLTEKEKDFKAKGQQLDKLAGEYFEMKSQQGTWAGGIWNNIMSGISKISATTASIATDIMTKALPAVGIPIMAPEEEKQKTVDLAVSRITEEDLEIAPSVLISDDPEKQKELEELINLGSDLNEIERAKLKGLLSDMSKEELDVVLSRINTGTGVLNEEISAKILDEARKQVKLGKDERVYNPYSQTAMTEGDVSTGIVEITRTATRDLLGDKSTTKQWEDLQKEDFWGGAILGLAESLPAMMGGPGLPGGIQRTWQMYGVISDAVDQEMEQNPDFDDITESEKYLVKAPIGIASGILEAVGFRNIVNQKGFLNSMVSRALGKSNKNTTAKTFGEYIRQDVDNLIARGLLTVGAGGLAEFETGALQELSTVGIKEIYNQVKEKEMFQQPDTFVDLASDVLIAGAQEGVGGFILSVPSAMSNAANTNQLKDIDNDIYSMFEEYQKDPEFKTMYVTKIKQQLSEGTITKEKADAELATFNQLLGLAPKIPQDLTQDQKKEALQLLLEKQELQSKIEGKEPELVKNETDRIAEINTELENIKAPVAEEVVVDEVIDSKGRKRTFYKTTETQEPEPGESLVKTKFTQQIEGREGRRQGDVKPEIAFEGKYEIDLEESGLDGVGDIEVVSVSEMTIPQKADSRFNKTAKVKIRGKGGFVQEFLVVLKDKKQIKVEPIKIKKDAEPTIKTPEGSQLFSEPIKDASTIAEGFGKRTGIDFKEAKGLTKINENKAREIAQVYEQLESKPQDPEVKKAYRALIDETLQQYDDIVKGGYTIELVEENPYNNSAEMFKDVNENKTLKIFSTLSGFGPEGITAQDKANNLLLEETTLTDKNGKPLLANDVFRFVHDFFGHGTLGNSFGPIGEENAWNVHSRMYSPLARRAMTTETRGQNSWVNFSGANQQAQKLINESRALRKEGKFDEAQAKVDEAMKIFKFAEQKNALMPDNLVLLEEEIEVTPTKEVEKEVEVMEEVLGKAEKQALTKGPTISEVDDNNWNKFVALLHRAFPQVTMSQDKDSFDRFLDEQGAQKIAGKGRDIKGVRMGNDIYLNPDYKNFNTPIHEHGHVWNAVMKQTNPEIYKKGLELVKNSPYYDNVKKNPDYQKVIKYYKKNQNWSDAKIEEYTLDEALATAIGDRGEAFVNKARKKRFLNWVTDMFKQVKRMMGITQFTAKQLETVTLDKFLDAVVVDMFKGKSLMDNYQSENLGQTLEFQLDEKPNNLSMESVINESRQLGFTDAAIKLYLQKQGYKILDINQAMEVPTTAGTNVPLAFGNVPGGMIKGMEMFGETMSKLNPFTKKKGVTLGEIREKAQDILKANKDFQGLNDTLQKELLIELDKSLGITKNKKISEDVKRMRAIVRDRKRGARELSTLRQQLKRFIIQNMPKSSWDSKTVKTLIREVSDAKYYKDFYKLDTKPGDDIRMVMDRVVTEINKQNVADVKRAINKLLKTKLTTVVGARKKGRFTVEGQDRINKIKEDLLTDKTEPEVIEKKINDLKEEYNKISNNNNLTEQQLNRMSDIDASIKYNEALLMDNDNPYKAETLAEVYENLKTILRDERSAYAETIVQAKERYNRLKGEVFEEVAGFNIDYNDKESVDNAKERLAKKENLRKNRSSYLKGLLKFANTLDWFVVRTEAFEGLIDRILQVPGELFGSKTKSLILEGTNEASRSYKEGRAYLQQVMMSKAEEIYGKDYVFIMKKNSVPNVPVYLNSKRANEIIEKIKEKTLPKGERAKLLSELQELTINLSQNEMYYLYNQAKDPANRKGLESKAGWGNNTDDILKQIDEKLDDNVRQWADWQVEEFFPSLYPRYNSTYKAIYRTNMPWNAHYAGRIVREGSPEEVDMFDMGSNNYQTLVGSQSTKLRVKNNKPIMNMDGDSMLQTYTDEMEYFRAYAETVRDINKIINDPQIKKAIQETAGSDVYKVLSTQIDKVANRSKARQGSGGYLFNLFTKNFVITRLGLNPTITLKQFTSAFAFADYIGYRNWFRYATQELSKGVGTWNKTWQEMYDNSPKLQDRYSRSDFARLLESYTAKNVDETLYSGLSNQRIKVGGKTLTVDKVYDFMMYLVKAGDKGGIMGSIPNYAFYKEQFLKKNPKATEQQAIDHAIRKTESQIFSTQQDQDIQNKDFFQTDNAFYRWMSLFTSSPRALLRKEIISIRNLYRKLVAGDKTAGRGTVKQNLRTFVTYHFVIPLFFQYVALGLPGLARNWREDDDEQLGMAAILGNLNSIFIIGDILASMRDLILDKPFAAQFRNIPIFEYVQEINENVIRMNKAKKPETKDKYFKRLINSILEPAGVPARQLSKWYTNIEKVLKGETDFGESVLRLFNFSDYVIEGYKPEKKDRKTKSISELNAIYEKKKKK